MAYFLMFLLSFLVINKTLRRNNLKTRTVTNAKMSVLVICVETIIYLFLYKLHDCTYKYKCITLKIAKDLDTVILPSKVNCLMHHNFKMLSILTICWEKFLSCSRFLLCEKWISSIFTVSLLRLTYLMPQSVTWTPFRIPIHAICLIRF